MSETNSMNLVRLSATYLYTRNLHTPLWTMAQAFSLSVEPLTGGIQAYDYEQPKERYPIDFLRAGYFLFLHVVAFTCVLTCG